MLGVPKSCNVLCNAHTVEDISLLQWSSVWDAMADDFIDRCAAGFGEVVVVERGGVAVPRYASLNRKKHVGYRDTKTRKGCMLCR